MTFQAVLSLFMDCYIIAVMYHILTNLKMHATIHYIHIYIYIYIYTHVIHLTTSTSFFFVSLFTPIFCHGQELAVPGTLTGLTLAALDGDLLACGAEAAEGRALTCHLLQAEPAGVGGRSRAERLRGEAERCAKHAFVCIW